MAELGQALSVVMAINAMLWLGSVAAIEMNPQSPVLLDCQGTLLGEFEQSNCEGSTFLVDDTDPSSQIPQESGEVETGSGNVFTDTFNAVKSWFADSTGVNYLYGIIAAPSNFLKALSVPDEVSFALGAMWYGFTLFMIVAFFFGRDY